MIPAITHAPRLLLSKPFFYLPALLVVFGLITVFALSYNVGRTHQDAMVPASLPLGSTTTMTLSNLPDPTPLKSAATTIHINDQPPVTVPDNASYRYQETSPTGAANIDITTEHHSSGNSTSSANLDVHIESSSTTDHSTSGSNDEQHISITQL